MCTDTKTGWAFCLLHLVVAVVSTTPSEGWKRGKTPRKPNSRATPQSLDQRLKREEVVPKMVRRKSSDAESRGGVSQILQRVPQALHEEFSLRFILYCIGKRTRSSKETEGIWQERERESCEKDFVSTKSSECV